MGKENLLVCSSSVDGVGVRVVSVVRGLFGSGGSWLGCCCLCLYHVLCHDEYVLATVIWQIGGGGVGRIGVDEWRGWRERGRRWIWGGGVGGEGGGGATLILALSNAEE